MERNEKHPFEVVCDAGPIIHLDEVSALDLLSDYAKILVPEAVWFEVSRNRPQALRCENVLFTRVSVDTEGDPVFEVFVQAFSLDKGEQEAILLSKERINVILLTDDAAARLVAERLGIHVRGTIGILVRAVRRKQRSPREVLNILNALHHRSSLYELIEAF